MDSPNRRDASQKAITYASSRGRLLLMLGRESPLESHEPQAETDAHSEEALQAHGRRSRAARRPAGFLTVVRAGTWEGVVRRVRCVISHLVIWCLLRHRRSTLCHLAGPVSLFDGDRLCRELHAEMMGLCGSLDRLENLIIHFYPMEPKSQPACERGVNVHHNMTHLVMLLLKKDLTRCCFT